MTEPEQWGPNLYAWLDAYWRSHNTNANAWADAHPGIQGATLSRWRSGTVPSLQAMRLVADAVDRPLVDVLTVAGAIRPGEAGDRPAPVTPEAPSIDVAIAQDPTLSPLARQTLGDILAAIRGVEGGGAGTTTRRRRR